MHCNICDKTLSSEEIIYSVELRAYEPCGTCLQIAFEAAYSDGFTIDDKESAVVSTTFDEPEISFDLSSFSPYGGNDN